MGIRSCEDDRSTIGPIECLKFPARCCVSGRAAPENSVIVIFAEHSSWAFAWLRVFPSDCGLAQ
jgi:hypothetical protein